MQHKYNVFCNVTNYYSFFFFLYKDKLYWLKCINSSLINLFKSLILKYKFNASILPLLQLLQCLYNMCISYGRILDNSEWFVTYPVKILKQSFALSWKRTVIVVAFNKVFSENFLQLYSNSEPRNSKKLVCVSHWNDRPFNKYM